MVQWNENYLAAPNEKIHYTQATVSLHCYARNNLVDQMQGDWLLMLDTDQTFEPDLVGRMLRDMNTYNLDVLAGVYHHKQSPHPPVMYKFKKDTKNFELISDWVVPKNHKGSIFIPIASAGAGALMVRRHVYERIRKELKEGPFDILHGRGEDHSFFMRLDKLGIKAYANPEIQTYHLKYQALSSEDFNRSELPSGEFEPIGAAS